MNEKRTLTLREPKDGGQVTGVVSIPGVPAYVEVFSSVVEAENFALGHNLDVIPPEDGEDELPQVPNQGRRN